MAEKEVQNDFSKGSIPAVVMRMALPLIAAQLVNEMKRRDWLAAPIIGIVTDYTLPLILQYSKCI